ncbi:hypothetical protein [Streptomyces africanus]|uniref:hypothetical protein n=1 Tax=Streptomyces africanus TaxID=231024 RepID=UPI000A370009|nr:hypothetical protein [Streptomyces africanus]
MTNKPDDDTPRYLTFVRTEARLTPEQVAAIAALRRRVAANRQDKAERITDNTLLRLAVDLLLANADRIKGDTEAEMRRALLGEEGTAH